MRVLEKTPETVPTARGGRPAGTKKPPLRRKWFVAVVVLCALTGLALLLARPVGVYLADRRHEQAIDEYVAAVEQLTDEELAEIRERAVEYNKRYATARPYIWSKTYGQFEQDYPSELRVPGTDVIGYLEIPAIDVRLPIYHDATDENMRRGCGHSECTSLPVGGTDGHAVLLSHRNMATAVTFERLDELQEGDTFSVTVLKETATFRVDSIRVVDPDNLADYADDKVEEGKQLCTLVTCTPNVTNTHRLFVRGVRVK